MFRRLSITRQNQTATRFPPIPLVGSFCTHSSRSLEAKMDLSRPHHRSITGSWEGDDRGILRNLLIFKQPVPFTFFVNVPDNPRFITGRFGAGAIEYALISYFKPDLHCLTHFCLS